MKRNIPFALLASLAAVSCAQKPGDKAHPNILFSLADDLGYGDLSCYDQKKFSTPNIDRLSQQGILFRQHYAGFTVSAPSRASLLAGMHTGHTSIRGNKEWKPERQWPLPSGSFTIAEMLKAQGYITDAFEKLGHAELAAKDDYLKQLLPLKLFCSHMNPPDKMKNHIKNQYYNV